jgi:hypothetical protein
VQRALVFLGVVLAVVILGWLNQLRETSSARAELAKAMTALGVDPGAVEHVEWTTELGPGGIDAAQARCPAGYRLLYGWYHSVTPDNAEIFFAGTFGSLRTWAVGLDNSANIHTTQLGSVTVVAACGPGDRPLRSSPSERAARRRMRAAVAEQAAKHR